MGVAHLRAGRHCGAHTVLELLRRCPELRRAVLPYDRPFDINELPIGAGLAHCSGLEQLRLVQGEISFMLWRQPLPAS